MWHKSCQVKSSPISMQPHHCLTQQCDVDIGKESIVDVTAGLNDSGCNVMVLKTDSFIADYDEGMTELKLTVDATMHA